MKSFEKVGINIFVSYFFQFILSGNLMSEMAIPAPIDDKSKYSKEFFKVVEYLKRLWKR